ncbi:MAG TPA: PilZ domain-containing protein [Spirochaetota bacterium]|nr:PilZ domain-containing protein [Spirochaetota bacterium]HOM38438.1 PilZ domain-containing protein [Spirochaetota bacterium]HPQ48978.1 PilZ domain-containing protein [Spirochaetota bacterium]
MKILLSFPNNIIDFFYFALTNEQHEVIGITEEKKLISFFEENTADVLIIDYEHFKNTEEVLNRIRMLSEKVEIIINTLSSNFNITKIIKENRIYAIIPKPCSLPEMLNMIIYYIERILKQPSKYLRKHPRFDIKSNHNIAIIDIKEANKKYIGKVKDISLGGIGIIVKDNINKYLIFQGKNVKVNIEIDDISFSFTGTVKSIIKDKIIGLSFKEINPLDIGRIKNYILKLMKEKTSIGG